MSTENQNGPPPTKGQAVGSGDLLGVGECGLHRRTPYGMTNVSMTQFSIARYYGGIKFQGDSYTYLPQTDELIRNDVLAWKRKKGMTPNDRTQRRRAADSQPEPAA